MSVHLQREIERLKKSLLSLCAIVEEQVEMAVRALLDRDQDLARHVQQRDVEIDHREVEIEEECLKTLALHQPVAGDLRLIIAAMKINNDLERTGDLAVNIARKAESFAAQPFAGAAFDLGAMSQKTLAMLRDSLDAMINLDVGLARSVCARDDEIDRMKRDIRREIEKMIQDDPRQTKPLLRLLASSRSLERIADLTTNIAEDVIYMVEGKIVRHREEE
jgi:phosphate transport system protein